MSNKARIREDAKKLNPIDDALFMVMAEEKKLLPGDSAGHIGGR